MQQDFILGHVHLKVRNLDRAIAFYTNLLGLRINERVGRYVFLTYGQRHHELAIHEVAADAPPPDRNGIGLYHFAIELPDTRALKMLCKRIEAAGVPVRPVDHGISKVLYFYDPDDNGVEAYVDTRVANDRFEWWQQSIPLDINTLPD
jgi:catechol 2,3-dioxygenase